MADTNIISGRTLTQLCADYDYVFTALSLLDVKDIAEFITPSSSRGPKPWNREPIVTCHIVMRWEGLRNVSKLINQLHRNRSLRQALGFIDSISPQTGRPSPCLPSRRTFLRVFQELQHTKVEQMLESEFVGLTSKLRYLLPGLGEDVCVDATTVKSFTRRKAVSVGHAPGQCPSADEYVDCKNPFECQVFTDPEASLGFKYCSKSPTGKRFVQGYKAITLSCAKHSIVLATIVTTGRAPESRVLKDLVLKAKALHPWLSPKTLIADAAYDALHVYRFLWKQNIEPIINIRDTPGGKLRDGIYTRVGVPTCMGKVEMEFVRTDSKTGFHLYRCQRGGCDRLGRIKGYSTCRDEVWEDPNRDWRLFGRTIRRGGPEWKAKYAMRYSIERMFAWWKDGGELENHCYRGRSNVTTHVLLTSLAFQLKRLSVAKFGQIDNPAR